MQEQAINIATKLYDEGFKNVTMVVGSDRVKEFSSLLNTYNGVEGKRHGFYKFDNINVVSAGERDPDAEGVTGMSASKMRQGPHQIVTLTHLVKDYPEVSKMVRNFILM